MATSRTAFCARAGNPAQNPWSLNSTLLEMVDMADPVVRAIALDPTFASAYAGLALALYYHVVLGFASDRDAEMARALDAGKTAVRLDENDPFAHVALGRVHTVHAQHDAAIANCDIAISITPSYANAHFGRAHSLWMSGRAEEAILSHDEAMRLSPRDPLMWAFMASKAIALIMLGRFEERRDLRYFAGELDSSGIAGTTIYYHAYVLDPSAPAGIVTSNAVRKTYGR